MSENIIGPSVRIEPLVPEPIERFANERDAAAIRLAQTLGGVDWPDYLAMAFEAIDDRERWRAVDVDPRALRLHDRVEELMASEGISYPAAVERLVARGAEY